MPAIICYVGNSDRKYRLSVLMSEFYGLVISIV